MKTSTISKKSFSIRPILVWTLLLNACLFTGLYLFFRTDVIQTLATSHLTSHTLNPATTIPDNGEELVAKNIPLSSPAIELIPQKTPNMSHTASTTSETTSSNTLPTLLETDTVSNTTTSTPISMTNIVTLPKKATNTVEKPVNSHDDTYRQSLTNSHRSTSHNTNPPKLRTANANGHDNPRMTELSATPTLSTTDKLLTDRDIPSQHRTGMAQKNRGQQELEAKTAQLSEAINQVKRLNQEAIDNPSSTNNNTK